MIEHAQKDPLIKGGCQCGAVRYALRSEPTHASICHCRMCQKAFGNYFAALTGVPRRDLAWTKGEPGIFKSSDAVERGFCRDCGTPLTFAYVERDRICVSIGSLDEPGRVNPEMQYGIERGRRRLLAAGVVEQNCIYHVIDHATKLSERSGLRAAAQ